MLRLRTLACAVLALAAPPLRAAEPPPGGPSAAETRQFMKALAQFVFDHHLKRDAKSPQAGMIYEYYDVARKGKPGQWIQGEALDTMHDGAWFVSALAQAYRATGDCFYLDFLEKQTLSFYLKMLNHSDELFAPERDDSAGKHPFDKEHLLQKGEKGFVPYWWDDGASVSLEALRRQTGKGTYPCRDELAGKPNPERRLSGYSLGSSNHMAQDLAVMLLAVWPLADGPDAPLAKLRPEISDATRNLYESRLKHFGHIAVIDAAHGLINGDAKALQNVPVAKGWQPGNEYARILDDFKPGQRLTLPGFTDNQEYVYWWTLARTGKRFDRAAVLPLAYDAYTYPLLYRYWSDNAVVPPGVNRFDLSPIFAKDGKMEWYRSDRATAAGSRCGPQNLIGCGRALQMLAAFPGAWDERRAKQFAKDALVPVGDGPFALDGEPDKGYGESFALGGVRLSLAADARALYVVGESGAASATVVLHGRPGADRRVTLEVGANAVRARGTGGAALRCEHSVTAAGGKVKFEVRLPFAVEKKQGPWWTPIEHGRYAVEVGGEKREVYVVSTEVRVKRALLAELAGGLKTWRGVFREKGYVPTAIGAGSVADTKWDNLSDAGGYAHLLAAGAQYLLYLEGRRDWEQTIPK